MRVFFFFNDTATTEIYTLSLHDALPILHGDANVSFFLSETPPERGPGLHTHPYEEVFVVQEGELTFTIGDAAIKATGGDRKSTRLNSSHANISYAVFCLKKKKTLNIHVALFYLRIKLLHANSRHRYLTSQLATPVPTRLTPRTPSIGFCTSCPDTPLQMV